jgi:hypothetical protein
MADKNEGFLTVRFFMVLSSMTPLFILWGIRGIKCVPDIWLWVVCGLLVVIPNFVLWLRYHIAKKEDDSRSITIIHQENNKDHLLVYLFAMLIPLYQTGLNGERDLIAAIVALLFVVFLFLHMNLHYMNIFFAIKNYHVHTIIDNSDVGYACKERYMILLSKKHHLEKDKRIQAYRLSNSVYVEKE